MPDLALRDRSGEQLAIANSNQELINLWLRGKSPHTQRSYRLDIQYFLFYLQQRYGDEAELSQVTLNDVHGYLDQAEEQGWSDSTINRRLAAIKSLLTFGNETGILRVNVGRAAKLKDVPKKFSERTLTESQVLTMIALTPNQRDRVLLRFMYAVAARVSEVCPLRWRDFTPNLDQTATVHIFGKGRKDRWVKFSAETWKELQSLRGDAGSDDYVFRSRLGDGLKPNQVRNIVRAAGKRIGVSDISPHWLRHSHAGHNVQRGTALTLIQETLGHESLNTTRNYLNANPSDSSALHLPV